MIIYFSGINGGAGMAGVTLGEKRGSRGSRGQGVSKKAVSGVVIMNAIFAAIAYSLMSPEYVDSNMLVLFQTLTIPVLISSRIPQILKIHTEKSTGQLAAFTVFNYFLGSLARVYTTAVEIQNRVVLMGFVLSFAANAILAFQMLYYWNSTSRKSKDKML
ncbi:Mannose-P-dolichol utilization defect 1 protein [Zancudomyces culisetae]|uniref:Mannose-P-dolichol utilization defect 1 protein n=1 Tax=Zancudomyces culisetae TaxID=1213189 RepID=A0A1R1PGZ3_ZANCU|nr:Mannose-P-dolichol utilization defect 1 protein [Zancudomyces culisetae]|eukprot:OMH80246.1 Mannose-P-dolichol utilization defect 1 protein [Zancudomyces culisetae]